MTESEIYPAMESRPLRESQAPPMLEVQLDLESGTICWQTSDVRPFQTVAEAVIWSRTKAQCESPIWLCFRNSL